MSDPGVRVRLTTDGKAEVINDFAQVGQAGEQAAAKIGDSFERQGDEVDRAAQKVADSFSKMFSIDTPDLQAQLAPAIAEMKAQFEAAGGGAEAYSVILEQLEDRYDAGARVGREYGDALAKISELYQAGFIDQEQAVHLTERATEAMVDATREIEQGTTRVGELRQGWRGLGNQVGSTAAAILSGQPPMQAMLRLTESSIGSVTRLAAAKGKLAVLMAGPWGAAIFAGTALLGGLISKYIEARKASDQNESSTGRLKTATDKLKEATEELDRIMGRNVKTQQQLTIETMNRASAALVATVNVRNQAKAELELARAYVRRHEARALLQTRSGDASAVLITAGNARAAVLEKALADNEQAIRDGMDSVRHAQANLDRVLAAQARAPGGGSAGGGSRSSGAARGAAGGIDRAAQEAERALEQMRRELETLEARFDPAAASARRFREEMELIQRLASTRDPATGAALLDPETADRWAWDARAARGAAGLADVLKGTEAEAEAERRLADEAKRRLDYVARVRAEQGDMQQMLSAEAGLLAANDNQREATLRLLSLKLTLQREGISLESDEAQAILATQAAIEASVVKLDEARASLSEFHAIGGKVIDTIFDPKNWENWGDLGKKILKELIADFIRLAAINPLKNELFNSNLPTMGGGGKSNAIGIGLSLLPMLLGSFRGFAAGTRRSVASLKLIMGGQASD